jgi:outer membrane protein/protease secretion system outer membrane protein
VDEVQARLDLLIAQSLEANQQVGLTQRQLQSIVGSPFSGLAQLDPQRFELLSPLPGTVDEWISLALESSPEIRALSAQQGAAREEIAKSRAGHLPTLDAIVQVQRSRSENANLPQSGYVNTSIGFQFNLPLYQGGYVSSVSRQAQADFERISELLEATRRELGIRVHKEYRGVTEGLARVKALEVAVRSADVALDSARKSLAAGVRTTVDVLNAQQQRVQVSRDLSQARYMTLLAKIRLEALAGRIDDGLMERLGRSVSP